MNNNDIDMIIEKIFVNTKLISTNYETTMKKIINRHNKKNSNQKVAARILKMLE